MGNYHSILDTTPQEQAQEFYASRYGYYGGLSLTPPHGYVRVRFFLRFERRKHQLYPDMEVDVPLDAKNGLDLRMMKDMWGLHDICAIDPTRWIPFEPGTERLSPVAVHCLQEHKGCINFFEPDPPVDLQRVREKRLMLVSAKKRVELELAKQHENFQEVIYQHTSLPIWYGQANKRYRRAKRHIERNQTVYNIAFSLFLFFILYLLWTLLPRLHLADRGRNWAMTGSLALEG